MGMILSPTDKRVVLRHGHMACGIGAGAKGFNLAHPRVGNLVAEFKCAGGIDVDAGAIANFEMMTGAKGTVMDLFDEEQFVDFHDRAPPPGWMPAMPMDIFNVFGPKLDILFASYPCKGFSGLLSTQQSLTKKYQALNNLTLRGMWLSLEAYKHDPVPIILFENVPRIMTRGRWLLDQIVALLVAYGYNVAESVHDCGEVGGLAQSRKRFLLVARHPSKVPDFMYEPIKLPLRGVGEVIGKLPLPGDPLGGVMHRIPELQWRTWVRLAFVEAGKDWRSLNRLEVENGVLKDYGIIREKLRDNAYGVCKWTDRGPLVTGARAPGQGRFSVADPRPETELNNTVLGVKGWPESAGAVPGASRPGNGAYSVADPRPNEMRRGGLGVIQFNMRMGVVQGESMPTNGAFAVADPIPRYGPSTHHGVLRVGTWDAWRGAVTTGGVTGGPNSIADPRPIRDPSKCYDYLGVNFWSQATGTIGGRTSPTNGSYSIADPRPAYGAGTHQNILCVVSFDGTAKSVTSARHSAGGALAVADVRIDGHPKSVQMGVKRYTDTVGVVKGKMDAGQGPYSVADPKLAGKPRFNNTFRIVRYADSAPAVAGPGGPGGGLGVADPRPAERTDGYKQIKYKVTHMSAATGTVIGASTTGNGAYAVADPRCTWGANSHTNKLKVVMMTGTAPTVTTTDRIGSGACSVADPRPACLNDPERTGYLTQGHYGVQDWTGSSGAIPAFAKNCNGSWSIADPRPAASPSAEQEALPAPGDRLICRIVAEDGTWHRPFTTLELAALQSLFDPEEAFALNAKSDAMRREWIGNAVPSVAAKGMAETVGEALLRARLGMTFSLSSRKVWVSPLDMALAVSTTNQPAWMMDAGLI